MRNEVESLTNRGSSPDELECELRELHDELRREFIKYHQREYKSHRLTAWLIRWLMSDYENTLDTCSNNMQRAARGSRVC